MTTTGWGEGPDDSPAMPMTARMLEAREHRAGPLETALARSRQADAREARQQEAEAVDPDERAAGYVARGYTPGLVSQLAGRLSDTVAELEAEREKIERGERVQARAAREHAAGRVDALSMIRMLDRDFGDAHRAEQLEKRAAGIRRQIAEAQDIINPQPLRDPDPLEAATRRANAAFRELTREKMAAVQQSRPQAPPPFASRASAGAADAEHTGPDCRVCEEGRRREAAELGYSQYQPSVRGAPREVTRARLEDLGYGEPGPGGCPPCSDCHYVLCRCGQPGVRKYPQAAGEPQVYA